VILRETQPGRYEQIAAATDADLAPLAVMQANMEFFHRKAAELMAVIMSLPTLTRNEATDAQVEALKDMAGLLKMREMAQVCARDPRPGRALEHARAPPTPACRRPTPRTGDSTSRIAPARWRRPPNPEHSEATPSDAVPQR